MTARWEELRGAGQRRVLREVLGGLENRNMHWELKKDSPCYEVAKRHSTMLQCFEEVRTYEQEIQYLLDAMSKPRAEEQRSSS